MSPFPLRSAAAANWTAGPHNDAVTRMERFVDPYYGSATYSHDSGGNLTGLHLAPNDRITYSYDAIDRLEVTVNPSGRHTTSIYDGAGRRRRTSIVYDAADRITSQWSWTTRTARLGTALGNNYGPICGPEGA